MLLKLPAFVLAAVLAVGAAAAGSFEEGERAYDDGDYAKALQLWLPLAEHGNPLAQTRLGFMYGNGIGVDRNVDEAIRWYGRASEAGQGYDMTIIR